METFQQTNNVGYFQKQTKYFTIIPHGIRVFTDNESSEYNFERVTKSTLLGQKKIKNKYAIIFSYFYLSFLYVSFKSKEIILVSTMLIIGLVFIYYYFWFREKTKLMVISDNKYVIFNYEKKNQIEVDNFISKVYKKRDEALLKYYTSFTKFLPFQDQYDGLMFLLHEDVINQDEFYYHFGKLSEIFEEKDID